MTNSLGVSNVDRSANGTRYTLTYDDVSDGYFKAGYVEVTGTLSNVRDQFDEPVRVGSVQYDRMMAAVKDYQNWADLTEAASRKPSRPMGPDTRHYYEPSQYGDNCAVCGNSQNTTVHKR